MGDTSTLIGMKIRGRMIDIPAGTVTDNDISTFITGNDVSNFITSNDVSNFVTDNDVSIYCTSTYVNSTYAKIRYISESDYNNLGVKDPSTLYIIPA